MTLLSEEFNSLEYKSSKLIGELNFEDDKLKEC